jgi:hypothetical protein
VVKSENVATDPLYPLYSFTNAFAANPTMVFPDNSLDAEFNNAKTTLDQILANLELLQNDSGTVANGSIGPAQLSASLQIGFLPPTVWEQPICVRRFPSGARTQGQSTQTCASLSSQKN